MISEPFTHKERFGTAAATVRLKGEGGVRRREPCRLQPESHLKSLWISSCIWWPLVRLSGDV